MWSLWLLKRCLVEVNRSFRIGVSGPRLDIYCYFPTLKKKKRSVLGDQRLDDFGD